MKNLQRDNKEQYKGPYIALIYIFFNYLLHLEWSLIIICYPRSFIQKDLFTCQCDAVAASAAFDEGLFSVDFFFFQKKSFIRFNWSQSTSSHNVRWINWHFDGIEWRLRGKLSYNFFIRYFAMPWSISSRWNSYHDVIEEFLYCNVIDAGLYTYYIYLKKNFFFYQNHSTPTNYSHNDDNNNNNGTQKNVLFRCIVFLDHRHCNLISIRISFHCYNGP